MMKLNDLKKQMKGVCIVQITPFNKDGSLDLEGMRGNTRWLLKKMAGKDAIFTPLGSTGEFSSMSDEERKAVIKMVVEEVNGSHPVIPGAAQAGTPETIKMCQYAQSVGADGAQVVLPYYHVPQEEGMYQHYLQVASSVDSNFGIMIYNNPSVSGSWVRPQLMQKITKIPNVVAIKENTPNILSYFMMQQAVDPADAPILCGLGDEMFPFWAPYGCAGIVSSMSNFLPDHASAMYEAAAARDFDKVFEVWRSISPFYKIPAVVSALTSSPSFTAKITQNHGPATGVNGGPITYIGVYKAAMDLMGLHGGEVRLPLTGINEEEKKELAGILKKMKVI